MNLRSVCMIFLFMALPTISWANHVIVNCGPIGYWQGSDLPAGSEYYVWLMNDDRVQLQGSDERWKDAGVATYGSDEVSLRNVALSDFQKGDVIAGPHFQMVLQDEFEHKTSKPRRFFYASFTAQATDGGAAASGYLECEFGLK